jgi:hypothetical protein
MVVEVVVVLQVEQPLLMMMVMEALTANFLQKQGLQGLLVLLEEPEELVLIVRVLMLMILRIV